MIQKSDINFVIDKSKIEGVKDMDNDIFPSHFLGLICGKPGSGKTSLLKFILKNEKLLFKKFDYVYILSPSWREYTSLFLPDDNFTNELDFEWIAKHINPIKKTQEYINVLFVIDDLVADLHKNSRSKEIMDFIFNRRHILHNGMISIIITSQKYKRVPTVIRSNITFIIFFRLNNMDLKQIKEELAFSGDIFDNVNNLIFSKQNEDETNNNNFMVYRIDNNVYFKNFNKILI